MTTRLRAHLSLPILFLSAAGFLAAVAPVLAQSETAAPDAPTPPRSPEGERIINFPSADVPRPGTLTILFTHRFSQALEDSDIHS
ncbi:MAG TPA: hypothetical protein VIZ58_10695, partial [Thermoanaerobaculia bacterium]